LKWTECGSVLVYVEISHVTHALNIPDCNAVDANPEAGLADDELEPTLPPSRFCIRGTRLPKKLEAR
jgi:hypothetical protein